MLLRRDGFVLAFHLDAKAGSLISAERVVIKVYKIRRVRALW